MKNFRIKLILATTILCLFVTGASAFANSKKTGVLVLAHGGNQNWDKTVNEATKSLIGRYPVEVAFGMANPKSMQKGIDKLESQGVTKIVVVQLFVSSYSPIVRQNEYLLGVRKVLADKPMLMDHSMMTGGKKPKSAKSMKHDSTKSMNHKKMNHNKMNHDKKKIVLKPLRTKSEIVLTKPLDDHLLVVDTLLEYIHELSVNPRNETIVIAAHGPSTEKDNKNWVKTMERISDQIRSKQQKQGTKFKQIFSMTVRDDANKAIYAQAREHLRSIVYQAGKDGDVIVIPLLLARGGVEARFVKRLDGLDYKWSGKTLLPHQNISKFIEVSVENALK